MEKPLLPLLVSALKGEKPVSLTQGLLPGDLVHLLGTLLGWPKGTILQALGYCLCFDAQGHPYALRIYVPLSPAHGTTYAAREAARFPEPGQQECWFAGVQMRFTEIDLTDHAHELALERRREGLVIQMYPERQQHRLVA
jgi:hypothetical protein